MLGYTRALVLLHRTFRRHPPSQRAHILGRFLTAPLLRTLDAVPAGARVLDIGAGHGLLARLLAEDHDVVAVDPDLRKVLTRFEHPRVRFVAGFDECIRGRFDAVTIVDVLYRVSPADRDALLARAHDRLRPGGTLIVKDLDPEARFKARWNRVQERIADALHLTAGAFGENDTRDVMRGRLERAGFIDIEERRIDRSYPHAHLLYVSRKRL